MAKQLLSGAKLLVGAFDLSGDHNAIALQYGADALDVTTIGDTTRNRLGGLKSFQANHAGLWSGGVNAVDDLHFNNLGMNVVSTLIPSAGAEGDRAFFGVMDEANYAPGGSVGEMLKFSVGLEGTGALYRGQVMHNNSRSASGAGTIVNLGAVPAGQSVSMAVHLLSITGGGTVQLILQSAALVGFASPTSRLDTGAMSAVGAQFLSSAGPITDAFWRPTWTFVGGSSPSATFLISAAIQ